MSNEVKELFPSNFVGMLHPNVFLVTPLEDERWQTVTRKDLRREIPQEDSSLADNLARVGQGINKVLKLFGYEALSLRMQVGNQSGKEKIGLGLFSPETSTILNVNTERILQSVEEWKDMLDRVCKIGRTHLDSDESSIRGVIESIGV
jgi:hypothetical protein